MPERPASTRLESECRPIFQCERMPECIEENSSSKGLPRVAGFLASTGLQGQEGSGSSNPGEVVIISTWPFGKDANLAALEILSSGGSCLDAVEKGVMTAEANPAIQSVGFGGLPNRSGVVELDAAIQDGRSFESGAVCALQGVRHPIQVARAVLNHSPHLVIVGEGAREFATARGFGVEETLSDKAKEAYERWVKKNPGKDGLQKVMTPWDSSPSTPPDIFVPHAPRVAWHGNIPGRVGDSPLLGHGLYADDQAGGCVATGDGEKSPAYVAAFWWSKKCDREPP